MPQNSYNHRRYYAQSEFRKTISKFTIRTGMIISFPYPGPSDRKPTVFVMDTNEADKPEDRSFSGINLDYLPIREVNQFFIKALTKMSWEVDKITKLPRGKLYDEEVGGLKPIALYKSIVKRTLLNRRDCWRTYKYNKVKQVEQIRFKFTTPPLNQIWQDGFEKLNKLSQNESYERLKENTKPKHIDFNQPSFNSQWPKLQSYRQFKEMQETNSQKYVKKYSKIYKYSTIKKYLRGYLGFKTAHVNFDKLTKREKIKFEADYKKGNMDMPVALKLINGTYELISGQTNLAGCFNKNINTSMFIIDMKPFSDNPERWKVFKKGSEL